MARHPVTCDSCHQVQVRKSGELCRECRSRGGKPVDMVTVPAGLPRPLELAAIQDETLEPGKLIEQQLRQARWSQLRVEAIMERPQLLLCAHCCENMTALETVSVDVVLRQQTMLARVLSWLVPSWLAVQRSATKAAEQMPSAEMAELLIVWFGRQPRSIQLHMHQALARIINERGATNGVREQASKDSA